MKVIVKDCENAHLKGQIALLLEEGFKNAYLEWNSSHTGQWNLLIEWRDPRKIIFKELFIYG